VPVSYGLKMIICEKLYSGCFAFSHIKYRKIGKREERKIKIKQRKD
jgi:hypothetical protein